MVPVYCAPQVDPTTLSAIVHVESRGNALAVHDNTTGRSYRPASVSEAQALLKSLLRLGHSVDAGLMQINSRNYPAYGLSADNVFDPCVNVAVGGAILTAAWTQASRAGLRGQVALWHAVQAYNSGNLRGAPAYAQRVWAAAGKAPAAHTPPAPATRVAFAQPWTAGQ
jgi:type IV secretion system protein VirB1